MLFLHSPLKNKLIGYGPDTFYLLYEQNLGNQMESLTGQIYDSPHSVILQYLLSCGIIGILLLLIAFLQILYRSIRSENDNRLLFLFPLLCYILQALVVPSTSMVTPYYFLFAGLLSRISFEQNPSLSNCSSLLEKKRQTCVTGTQK